MNKAYKVIYNETTGTYVAVSELETSHGKATQSIKTSTFTKLHALGSIKRLDFNKFTLASLGIFTAFAMPMAHASWVNNVNGADYGQATGTGSIAIGSDSSTGKAIANGNQSTAIGYQAATTNDGGTAIGANSITKGVNATALGYNANTDGFSSLALGADTTVFGNRGIAIGNKAQAFGGEALAIGTDAQALGDKALAIGDRNQSLKHEAITVGLQNKANGEKSSIFGHRNVVDNYHGLAVGHDSFVDGDASVSVGSNSLVAGANSMSFGNDNWLTGDNSVVSGYGNKVGTSIYDEPTLTYQLGEAYNAVSIVGAKNEALSDSVSIIGQNNTIKTGLDNTVILGNNVTIESAANSVDSANGAIFKGSVALGSNTKVEAPIATTNHTIDGKVHNFEGISPVGTVSVGASGKERTITNLAAGRISGSSTDAINGSQLYALTEQANAYSIHFVSINSKDASKANYGNDGAKGIDGIAIGVAANSLGNYAVAIGSNANASGLDNIAIGKNALTNSHSAIAIGTDSFADFYSTVIGQRAQADTQAVALGSASKAADNAVAIGHQANAAIGAASIGSWAEANGLNSIALGTNAEAQKEATIAIGGQSNAYADRSTAIGVLSTASGNSSIALGELSNAMGNRGIAIGQRSQALGQYSTSIGLQSIAAGDISTSLGAFSNATGTRTVAIGNSALTTADYSVALGNLTNSSVANSVAIGSFARTTAANATNITGTAGQIAKGVVSVGRVGFERQIQNVAAGRVDAGSTDAINGSQLYALTSLANANSLHYLSVNDNGTQGSNHDNKGAAGKNSIAIGVNTSTATTAENAVALGFKAQANGTDTIAIGTQAKAIGNTSNTIVIGNTSTATNNNGSLVFGNGNNSNNSTETIQIGSGNTSDTSRSVASIGGLNRSTGSLASSIIGINNSLSASSNSSISGINNNVAGSTFINVSGFNNTVTNSANNSIIGNNNVLSSGNNNIITGFDNNLGSGLSQTQILGSNITVESNVAYGIAVGSGSKITKNNAVTLGANAIASETGSVAIGANSVANIASGIAGYIPTGTSQAQINAINNTKSTSGAVSVGDVQNNVLRQITGVAAGTADSDAVNVAQLKAISASIPANLHYFSVNSTGGGNFLNDGASGIDAIAIGKDTIATGENSHASGKGSKALGTNSYASGTLSTATGGQAVAIGNGAFADGAGNTSDSGAIAIGANAYARTQGGGNTAIALGSNAFAEHSSIAMGHNAQATKLGSIALGYQANTTNSDSGIAIGDRALTSGKNAIAIGGNAYTGNTSAQGDGALAVGSGATSSGWGAVALGGLSGSNGGSQANEDFAVAIGSAAHALASGAVAIGGTNNSKANASGIDSLAIGAGSQTQIGTQNAMAIGTGAKALSNNALSLGANSSTTQAGGVALGNNSVSSTAAGIVGYIPNANSVLASNAIKATTSTLAAVSVGNVAQNQFRQITGLAAGTADSDAVNVAQLKALSANTSSLHFLSVENPGSTFANYNNDGASGAGSIAIGVGTTVAGKESIAIGKGITLASQLNNNLIIGNSASANSSDATVLGYKANAQGTGTVAIGSGANTIGSGQSVAIGTYSESSVNSVALGYKADASSKQSVTIGSFSKALAQEAVAMGMQATASQTGAIAIGKGSEALQIDSIALGRGSITNQANSIALGAYSSTKTTVDTAGTTIAGVNYAFKGISPNGAVSVGSDGKERQVQNVAAGQINKDSTDAINGSQLYAAYNAIDVAYATGLNFAGNTGTNIRRTLGQTLSIIGAAVNPINTVTYDATTVATASDYSAKNVQTVTDGSGNMQIQFAERPVFDAVTANTVTANGVGGNTVTLSGNGITISKNGTKDIVISGDKITLGDRQLANVADGTSLTDAVNFGQLKDLGTSLTNAGLNFKDNAGNITKLPLGNTLSIIGAEVLPTNSNVTYEANTTATAGNYSAKNIQTISDGKGNIQIQMAERPVFDAVTANTVTANGVGGNTVILSGDGITISKNGTKDIVISGDKITLGDRQLANVADGTSLTDAVNFGQLKDLGTSLTNAGLNFKDNAGNITKLPLGNTLSIIGAEVLPTNSNVTYEANTTATAGNYSAKNIQTISDGKGNIQIQMAERPVFDTVTANTVTANGVGGNTVTLSGNGITISKNGTKDIVISGDKITLGDRQLANVADGTSLTDAVNFGQLKDLGTSLTNAGLNFKDNAGNITKLPLGNTLSIIGAEVLPTNSNVTYEANTTATAGNYSAKNIQTISDGKGNIQIQMAERPVFDAVTANTVTANGVGGNTVILSGDGITISKNGTKDIVISSDKITLGDRQLANVAAGTSLTDAVNVSQLQSLGASLTSTGLNFAGNSGNTLRHLGDTLKIYGSTSVASQLNGENTDTAVDSKYSSKNIQTVVTNNGLQIQMAERPVFDTLTANTVTANGVGGNTVILSGDGITISKNGTKDIVISSDKITLGDRQLANVAAGTSLTDAVNLSQLNQAIAGSKYAGLKVENGTDIITANESLNIIGKDGTTVTYDKNSNTYTVTSQNGGSGGGRMNDWNVTGTDGKGGSMNVPISNGNSVDFVAGSKNVVVTPSRTDDGARVTIDVAQDLNLSSVTTKNADGSSTVVNGNGVTIKGKDGKNGASITQAGIDAGNQKLTNVAAGTEATDAVNVSQLNAVSGSINNLSNRINEVEDNANAGTATAIAIANLPQAYEPGARVFSVAAGTYEGETGYAVGYSAISDGGNWIIKASGTANSQQKFGAGAGVGYRWR